jgi:membrane fusion protein, multidrug efflux system
MNNLKNYFTILIATVTLAACTTKAAENKVSNVLPGLPVDVKIAKQTKLLDEEVVAGSILPNREVTIMSETSRKVVSIHFNDGNYVRQGQLLYKLDDRDIHARLKQAHAELALAKLNGQRLAELLKKEAIRQEEYDVAATRLQSLQASVELLQVELDKTAITAPFAGTVGISKVESGSLVSPGLPLVTLLDETKVKIQFSVSEKYLKQIRAGKSISFSVVHSAEKLQARIVATESGIDVQSRNITVQAVAFNDNGLLKPGMSARIYFSTVSDDATGIKLPTESLIPGEGGYAVFVVRNGVAHIQPVKIGSRNDTEALITQGLHDGDTVMISNILRSGEGTPVQIVSSK